MVDILARAVQLVTLADAKLQVTPARLGRPPALVAIGIVRQRSCIGVFNIRKTAQGVPALAVMMLWEARLASGTCT